MKKKSTRRNTKRSVPRNRVAEAEKTRTAICTLNKDDLKALTANRRIVEDDMRRYKLVKVAFEQYWNRLREKYDIPENIAFDERTGEVFAVELRPKES